MSHFVYLIGSYRWYGNTEAYFLLVVAGVLMSWVVYTYFAKRRAIRKEIEARNRAREEEKTRADAWVTARSLVMTACQGLVNPEDKIVAIGNLKRQLEFLIPDDKELRRFIARIAVELEIPIQRSQSPPGS